MAETNTNQPNPQGQGIFQENANQDIINMDSQQSGQGQTPPQGADGQQVTDTVTPQGQGFFSQNANQDIINMDSQKESSQGMKQDIQQVVPLNEEEQQNFIQDLGQTLRDRLTKAQKDGQEVDGQLRDQVFADIVSGMGGRLDINNPDVVRLRDRVYQNALLGFQKDRWEDVYSGMQNTFQRTQLLNQMDNSDIAGALQSGTIKYKDIRGLQVFNPQKYQDVIRQYSELKRSNTSNVVAGDKEAKDYDTETMVPTAQEYAEQVSEEYDTPLEQIEAKGLLSVYDQMMGSASLQGEKDRLTEVNGQVAKLQNEKSKLYKKLENKITDKAILDAVYRDQVEDINLELSTLLAEQSTLQASVDSQIQSAKDRFDIAMKEYEIEQDREMEILGLQKDFYNQQIQIMNASIPGEAKEYFLKQNVVTQASLFGLNPEVAAMQLKSLSELDLSTGGDRDITLDKENGYVIRTDKNTGEWSVQSYLPGNNPSTNTTSPYGLFNNLPSSFGDYDANGNLIPGETGDNLGIDFSAERNTPIQSSYDVVIKSMTKGTGGSNNQIVVQTKDGQYQIAYNHLDDSTRDHLNSMGLGTGSTIYAGQTLGFVGNTGNVYSNVLRKRLRKDGQVMPGQEEALSQGYGSHVDIVIRDADGLPILGNEAWNVLKGVSQQKLGYDPSLSQIYDAVIAATDKDGTMKTFAEDLGISIADLSRQVSSYSASQEVIGNETILQASKDLLENYKKVGRQSFITATSQDGNFIEQGMLGFAQRFGSSELQSAAADFNYIISVLTLGTLADLKAKGGTLGAINRTEFETLKNAASRLSPTLSKTDFEARLQGIIDKLNAVEQRVLSESTTNSF